MARSLARALRSAGDELRAARRDVEELLASLYPEWRPLHPAERAWRFTESDEDRDPEDPDEIHVFGVVDSPAATEALHRVGFGRVTAHDHTSDAQCACETHVE